MVSADSVQAITIGDRQPACPDPSKLSTSAEELFDPSVNDCAVRLRDVISAMTEMRRQHDQTTQVMEFIAATLEKQGSICCHVKHPVCPAPAHLAQETQLGSADEEGGVRRRASQAVCPPTVDPAEDALCPPTADRAWAGSEQKKFVKDGDHRSPHLHGERLTSSLPSPLRPRRLLSRNFDELGRSICARRGGSQMRHGMNAGREALEETRSSVQTVLHKPSPNEHVRLLIQGTADLEEKPTSLYGTAAYQVERLFRSQWVECLIGCIILANSICIGVETQQELTGESDPVFQTLEHMFLAVYLLEICLRLLAVGRACFWDSWFLFDLLLVMGGCVASWVLTPIYAGNGPGDQNRQVLSQLMVFRICRLLRLLRAMRMVKKFRSMWRLVYGLLTSFNTMITTLSLVGLVLYTFACLGIEMITKDPNLRESASPEVRRIVDTFFTDLFVTQMFLFQFVTLDSVAAVYMPLIKEKPILAIYFLSILLVVSISLMNLVMAKIVEGALDAAHHDHEMERQQRKESIRAIVPVLKDIFARMDQDGSGHVELRELQVLGMTQVPEELAPLVMMDSMVELFEILDVDNSGTVSQDEFIEGMLSMHISEVPLQQVQMLQMMRALRDKVSFIESHFSRACVPAVASDMNVSSSVGSRTVQQEVNASSGGLVGEVVVVAYI
uniref:EF-hand domain-containing protein n=1 Tax=Alexandrium monilatum TaxID=311494 RepID=A0A7S4RIE2_9DINO